VYSFGRSFAFVVQGDAELGVEPGPLSAIGVAE
jgi:hypothetical protein